MKRRTFLKSNTLGALFLGNGLNAFSLTSASKNNKNSQHENFTQKHNYDVIVCGGGPAGVAAALASAREGSRTALIEMQGYLGGIWTTGLLDQIVSFHNKEGIMKELMEELKKQGNNVFPYTIDHENMKTILEKMCMQSGVHLRYYTRLVSTKIEKNRLKNIVTISNSGLESWEANAFIDTTGNGDLSAYAGCDYHIGHPETGEVQPMTLMAVVGGLDFTRLKNKFVRKNGLANREMKTAFRKEIEKAGISPSYGMPSLSYFRDKYFGLMVNHEFNVSALDAGEMTKATIRARLENHEIVNALKSLGGIWENIHMAATAHQIGIREARRIAGRYYLTVDDLKTGAKFKDGICTVNSWADIHSLNKNHSEGYSDEGVRIKPYQIPLRSLIARDIDGLLMAGRCISGDFYSHASYRVTGNAVPMGEAAGKCAAYAASHNVLPHQVDAFALT